MAEESPQAGGATPEKPVDPSTVPAASATPAPAAAPAPAAPAEAPAIAAAAATPTPTAAADSAAAPPAPVVSADTSASPDAAAVAAAEAAIASAPAEPPPPAADAAAPAAPDAAADIAAALDAEDPFGGMDQASIDELLKQASFDDPSVAAAPANVDALTAVAELPETAQIELPNFSQVMQDAQVSSIDLLRDVDLNVKIELGRSRMFVEDVLKLSEGSVVELDKLAGDPVDVFVNDRLVARGEVLVLNDNFCVRINEIVAGVKEEGL
jgi:flagellar motor switch protein FliN/FliY